MTLSLDLKSTRLDALLLPLRSREVPALLAAAQAQWGEMAQAFEGEPLVLDASELPAAEPALNWATLVAGLRGFGLQPVSLLGAEGRLSEADLAAARSAGLSLSEASAPLPAVGTAASANTPAGLTQAVDAPSSRPPCMVIDRPLRSGQQIYARDADLIVLGLVSHGAEVIADGHIHVYGALRGRAIAGAKGDTAARVFAQSFEPELLAIAGTFRTSEKPLPAEVAGKPAMARLDGERLVFEPLKY